MTKKELQKTIKIMRAKKREVQSSKNAARKFLVDAGICTEKGNLRKHYR